MSKVADYAQQWLEEIGYELGYNENLLPKINDFVHVTQERIPVWKYWGYKTERGFYSTTGKVKPFRAVGEIIKEYEMEKKEYWEDK